VDAVEQRGSATKQGKDSGLTQAIQIIHSPETFKRYAFQLALNHDRRFGLLG
jgi:hypothetical protein